jgi:hypothetical protein
MTLLSIQYFIILIQQQAFHMAVVQLLQNPFAMKLRQYDILISAFYVSKLSVKAYKFSPN